MPKINKKRLGCLIDLTGKKFGKYKVIKYLGNSKWKCVCSCGGIVIKQGSDLKSGHNKMCIKCRRKYGGQKPIRDISGMQFSRWTVLNKISRRNNGGSVLWKCRCKCKRIGYHTSQSLISGNSKGCPKCAIYRVSSPEAAFMSLYRVYRAGARRRGMSWRLSIKQFRNLTQQKCYYTSLPPSSICRRNGREYIYNGIDRINSKLGYSVDNCVPCVGIINRMKMNMPYSTFIDMCALVTKTISEKVKIENKLKAV